MLQHHDRMKKKHSRSGIAHDPNHLFSRNRMITVDFTKGTKRFILSMGTFFVSDFYIGQKLFTIFAKRRIGVMLFAIQMKHFTD